jgi:ribosomal protein L29
MPGLVPGIHALEVHNQSRADLAEELRDLAAELLALRFQRLRGAADILWNIFKQC